MRSLALLLLAPIFIISCGSSDRESLQSKLQDSGPADLGIASQDGGRSDAGDFADAGFGDAAPADSGPSDTGTDDAGLADTGAQDSGPAMPDVTFTEHVWPVFEASGCGRVECHGSLLVAGGSVLMLSSPEVAFLDLQRAAVTSTRRLVVPGMPQASELFVHGRDANMPAGDLTLAGLQTIEQWIALGAARGPDVTVPVPPEPSTCDIAGRPGHQPLPQACLPRCTAETRQATIDCRMASDPASCQAAVFAADPTPAASIAVGPDSVPLGCGFCLQWQTLSCSFEACPVEALASLRCPMIEPSSDDCAAVGAALSACLAASNFSACQAPRDGACFQ